MTQLSTTELKAHILEELKPIREYVDLQHFFFNDKTHGEEGCYIFSDKNGYHYVQSERGNEELHKITNELFEITFWTLHDAIIKAVFHSMPSTLQSSREQRQYMLEQEIFLLEKMGSKYKEAGETEIYEMLKENPL